MNKSTLALIVIATLLLGALIGAGVSRTGTEPQPTAGAASVTSSAVVTNDDGGAPVIRFLAPEGVETPYDEFGTALPYLSGDNFLPGQRAWQEETLTIVIEGDGAVEYKALMSQGDSLNFHWSVNGGQAYYDLHAHDSAFGDEFFTRYDEGEGSRASGTIVAPYDGEHGWFWLNLEAEPITISLQVAGFYKEVVKIDMEAEE